MSLCFTDLHNAEEVAQGLHIVTVNEHNGVLILSGALIRFGSCAYSPVLLFKSNSH